MAYSSPVMLSLHLSPLPTLTTARPVLRQVRMDDAPACFAMRAEAETMRHMPVFDTPHDLVLLNSPQAPSMLQSWF